MSLPWMVSRRSSRANRHDRLVILDPKPTTRDMVETSALGIHAFAPRPLQFAELSKTLGCCVS